MNGFGTLLRRFRHSRDLSLGTVAGCIGIAQSHLSDVENGRRPALRADRIKMCQGALSLTDEETRALYLAAAIDRGAVDITNKTDMATLDAVIWLLCETKDTRDATVINAAAHVINTIKRLNRDQQSAALSLVVAAIQSGRVEAA